MKLLLICKDAQENSLITNLLLAIETRRKDGTAGVIFTEEALVAISGQFWDWSPLLRDRVTRMTVAQAAQRKGIPLASAKDSRKTDPRHLISAAKEAGVNLFACPVWTELLGLDEKLPAEITKIDLDTVMRMIKESNVVIGNF